MKKLKKISLENVSEKFSDSQLKRIIGGYNDNCYMVDCWCDDGSARWEMCQGESVPDWVCHPGTHECV